MNERQFQVLVLKGIVAILHAVLTGKRHRYTDEVEYNAEYYGDAYGKVDLKGKTWGEVMRDREKAIKNKLEELNKR